MAKPVKVGLLTEYENIMIGSRKTYSADYMSDSMNNSDYAPLLQYIFKDILGWDAETFQNKVTMELIEKLKLKRVVARIKFPPELSPEKDLFYLATLIYPDEVTYKRRDYILMVYKSILEKRSYKFPRSLFREEEGLNALKICLLYALQEYLPHKSVRELFLFFADNSKAHHFLSSVRLESHIMAYCAYPIDFLYDTMPKTEETEFWYHYGRFLVEWRKKFRGTAL